MWRRCWTGTGPRRPGLSTGSRRVNCGPARSRPDRGRRGPAGRHDRDDCQDRRAMSESASNGQARIVVGVDGSEGSAHALRWAARQARLTGAALEAVTAWQYPAFFGWAPVGPDAADFGKIAEKTLTDALNQVFGTEWPDWVRTRVVERYPSQALLEGTPARAVVVAAAGAGLLVVGSRGYGGFPVALLGSVSTYCVPHARGPVSV